MAIQLLTSNVAVSDQNKARAQKAYQELLARQDLGFFQIPKRPQLFEAAQALGQKIRDQFDELVVVGIGGSSLGPRALHEFFFEENQKHRLHFCDNTDATMFERLCHSLNNPQKTAWVFISKSGTTLETLAAFDFANQFYRKKGQDFFANTFFVTEIKPSPLYDFAIQHQRPILEIPLDVGGRFSVLTAVGMLPAAFMGLKTEEFRLGAESALAMKERVLSVAAHSLQSFEREEWITLFWHYSSLTRYLGGWIQQLWAESLAKEKDRHQNQAKRASTPMSAIGACDQHSILQQVMEGAKDKFVIFIRVGSAESSTETLKDTVFPQHKYLLNKGFGQILAAEAEATSLALTQSKVSNMVLHIPDLSPRTVGFLFMFWELVVGIIGEAMNIDAFNQPGVELGKRLAKQILDPTKLS